MEPTDYHILAGYVKAQNLDAEQLKQQFRNLIATCNQRFKTRILSKFSISPGSEFIGVTDSQKTLLETIFYLEEEALNRQLKFTIKYVGLEGKIETSVNQESVHEMIGEGLTDARALLDRKSRGKPRIQVHFRNTAATEYIKQLLIVLSSIKSRWNTKDGQLIVELINHSSDAIVGDIFKKTRSQIWKRRKSLQVQEYCIIKQLILESECLLPNEIETLNN